MFQMQTLNGMVHGEPIELDGPSRARICKLFASGLKSSSTMRGEILRAGKFPSVLWDPTEPGLTSGLSYQFDREELEALYKAVKPRDGKLTLSMDGRDTEENRKRAEDEFHAVYRLLRRAARD
uniref:Uncharacterized protein n=1 Tax=Cryptomonas curvata TaxID=233186 RepID=A0A7S0MJC2_9CRYP|mmetsp:Transcript_42881/g.89672  ORF Transcript_42881/g.89672 Transcript_42881/m.89672 type:complete len:123 (+) Transcript_42881:94-462(+)